MLLLPLGVAVLEHGEVHPVDVVGDLGVNVRVPAVPASLPGERDDAVNLPLEDQRSPRVTLQSEGTGGRIASPRDGGAGAGHALTAQTPRSVALRLAPHSMLAETRPRHSVRHRLRLTMAVSVSISCSGRSP